MPQFNAGVTKTARITFENPTAISLDYQAALILGAPEAARHEESFSIPATSQKAVNFPVAMPSLPGSYPVFVHVVSGGKTIGVYQATEDVEIVGLALTFSIPQGTMLAPTGIGYGWRLTEITCQLSNPNNVAVTRQIRVLYGGGGGWSSDRIWEYQGSVWKDVTLSAGQSVVLIQPHEFIIPNVNPYQYGTVWNQPAFAIPSSWSFKLVDDLGNESQVITLVRSA